MNIRELRGELAANPRPCYLAVGSDIYMCELARRAFIEAIPEAYRLFNLSAHSAIDLDAATLWRDLDALPVGGEMRVCLISNWHKADKELEESIGTYLDKPNPSTVLGLVGESADMRRKLPSRLKAGGTLVDCSTPDRKQVAAYIVRTAEERGYVMPPSVAVLVVELCGGDLGGSVQATLALTDYVGERKCLTEDDARSLLGKVESRTAFDLVEAMGRHQAGVALTIAKPLWEKAGEAEKLVGLVERQLRLLLLAKANPDVSPSVLAGILGVNPYFVKDYVRQAGNFASVRLQQLLRELAELDVASKTGRAEIRTGLEMFILNASHAQA